MIYMVLMMLNCDVVVDLVLVEHYVLVGIFGIQQQNQLDHVFLLIDEYYLVLLIE